MNEMAHSAGDADRELEIFAESLPYKLNRLKETGTGIWQTILNRGTLGTIIDGATAVLSFIDKIIEKVGLLKSVLIGFATYKGITTILPMLFGAGAAGSFAGKGIALLTTFFTGLGGALPYLVAAGATIAGIYTIYKKVKDDQYKNSLEYLQEDAQKAQQDVDELQSKLDEQSKRIEELNNLKKNGGLSSAEQTELDNLESQNALYQQQLELLENIARYKQERAARRESEEIAERYNSFVNNNQREIYDYSLVDAAGQVYSYRNTSGLGGLYNAIDDYKSAQEEISQIRSSMAEYSYDDLTEDDIRALDSLDRRLNEQLDNLNKYEDTIADFQDMLIELRGNLTDEEQIATIDQYLNLIGQTLGLTSKGFSEFLEGAKSDYTDAFEALSKEADLTAEKVEQIIEDFPEFRDWLRENGWSTNDVATYMNRVKSNVDETVSEVSGGFTEVESSIDAATAALQRFQDAINGEYGDVASQYQDAYNKFLEDWEAGRTGSKTVRAAIELFIPDEVQRALNYDVQQLGELLASDFYKGVFGGEGDPGQNFANYIREHQEQFAGVADVIENADGSFSISYTSLEELANACGLTLESMTALVDAWSAFGSEVNMGSKDIMNLADSLGLVAGNGESARDKIVGLVNALTQKFPDKTDLEIAGILDQLERAGYIDLSNVSDDLGEIIHNAQGAQALSEGLESIAQWLGVIQGAPASGDDAIQNLANQLALAGAGAEEIQTVLTNLGTAGYVDLSSLSGDLSTIAENAVTATQNVDTVGEHVGTITGTEVTISIDDQVTDKIPTLQRTIDSLHGKTIEVALGEETDNQFNGLQRFFGYGAGGEGTIGVDTEGNLRAIEEYRDNVERILSDIAALKQEEENNPWSADPYIAADYQNRFDALTTQYTNAKAELDAALKVQGDQLVDNVANAANAYNQARNALAANPEDITLQANVEQAQQTLVSALQELDTFSAENPEVELTATDAVKPVVDSAISEIASLPSVKTISIVARYSSIGSFNIPGHAGGTNNAEGGPTLVNELGPELISDHGQAYIAGGGKPTITYLNPGAIVLNANDTRRAFSGGLSDIPIQAFAAGTKNSLLRGKRIAAKAMVAVNMADGGGSVRLTQRQIDTYLKGQVANGSITQRQATDIRDSGISTYGKLVGAVAGAKTNNAAAANATSAATFNNNSGGSGGGGGGGSNSSSSSNKDDKEKKDWIEIAIDRLKRAIDSFAKVFESGFKSLSTRMSASVSEISKIKEGLNTYQQGYDRYIKEANSVGLSSDLAQRVRDGTIDINEYDKDTADLISQYQEWYEKAIDCKEAIDDLHESLAELYQDRFDAVREDFENQLNLITHRATMLENEIDVMEARGRMQSADYYVSMQSITQDRINLLKKEYSDLQAQMQEAMNSGEIEKYSDAWYGFQSAIDDVEEELADANLEMIEFSNTIRKISWDNFDYLQDKISQVTKEADFLIDLLENNEMFDDAGQLTSEGLSVIGLHGEKYNVLMQQAEKYAEEMAAIDKELADDPYNKDLIKRREDLLKLQQDSIKAANEEKSSIKNLVEEGYKSQLSALKDLIDEYKESLDNAKSLYDYQEKITDKTEAVAKLQKQLSAYFGDTSEETRSTVQKLQTQLEKAQEDLQKTEYEQFISDQKKLLDNLYEEYEEVLNDRLDDMDALMDEMINTINFRSGEIRETLEATAKDVGYTLSDSTKTIWDGALVVLSSNFKDANADFLNQFTAVRSVLGSIQDNVAAIVTAGGLAASKPAYKSGGIIDFTGPAWVDGSKSQPESIFDAQDTENLIGLRNLLRTMSAQELTLGSNGFIAPAISGITDISGLLARIGGVVGNAGTSVGDITINIPIDHVEGYNDFITQLQHDKQFEKMVLGMTLGRANGKSSLSKNTYRW